MHVYIPNGTEHTTLRVSTSPKGGPSVSPFRLQAVTGPLLCRSDTLTSRKGGIVDDQLSEYKQTGYWPFRWTADAYVNGRERRGLRSESPKGNV